MKFHIFSKKILLPVILFLLPTLAFAATLDERIAQQKKELDILNKRVKYHTRELAEAKAKEKTYLRDLSVYDHKLQQTEEEIALLDLQIQKNQNELKQVSAGIAKRNERVKKLQKVLAERCVAIYKYGGAADLNAMLSAQDLAELNNLTYLMNRLSREDEKNIEALESELLALKTDEMQLQQTQGVLAQRFKKRQRDRDENRQASARRRELLDRVKKEKRAHQAVIDESEEAQRELQKKINDYLRRKALEAKNKKGTGKPKYKHKGKFDWPLKNYRISSNFGTRIHPKFKTKRQHTGIDLAAPTGTPIYTAAAGEVIFAGWMRGYGQVTIIDHGSGYATVYAHMSKISVEEGKNVKKGAIIGKVGQTGVATGPHLHFEVRVNGKAQNPLKYL